MRVFNYKIPQGVSDDSSVIVKASAYRGTVHNFDMKIIAKDANWFNETTDSINGMQAWKKGQVARINKKNFKGWCLGCEIQILISSYDQGYYHVVA